MEFLNGSTLKHRIIYLKLYPPERTPPDPALAATQRNWATSKIVPVELSILPTNVAPPSNDSDSMMIVFLSAAEIFVALLFTAGLCFTFYEVRRATAVSVGPGTLGLMATGFTGTGGGTL